MKGVSARARARDLGGDAILQSFFLKCAWWMSVLFLSASFGVFLFFFSFWRVFASAVFTLRW